MSDATKKEIPTDLKSELNKTNSHDERMELLLIAILRKLKEIKDK